MLVKLGSHHCLWPPITGKNIKLGTKCYAANVLEHHSRLHQLIQADHLHFMISGLHCGKAINILLSNAAGQRKVSLYMNE